jgi:hypothetical protein
MNRIGSWVRHHTHHFTRADFWPGCALKQAGIVFAAWACPAIVGVLATNWLGNYRSVKYLQSSIQEGIGPHIWNVFAVLGFLLAGVQIAAPRQKWLAIATYQVLQNTYSLGALTYGLLLGQWICIATSQHTELPQVTVGFMFAFAFFLNLAIWYLAFLVAPARLGTGFMHSVARMAPQFRIPLALLFVLTAVASLYLYLGK